ncbi:MAG: ABC transporter permease [Candidatus Melainabacteria bacterium]|nr:ABC transporter permease [Candidatus Melainabacteria bacterium]MBI3308255.1 ABC transporter permease [Candidatus Melainabacteria bacterium]
MPNSTIQHSTSLLPENIPPLKKQIEVLGLSTILLLKSYAAFFSLKVQKKITIEQIIAIGFNTLPIVILMTVFSGMVISLETADWLDKYGARDTVGALVALTAVIELAPIFVSFAIGAQAGTAITAELAHMQITEQISALRLSKVSPITYLVAPRLLAAIYSLPFSIITGAFLAIIGGMFIANVLAGIEYSVYLDSVWRALESKDIFYALIKGFVFANYIIIINTAFGLGTRGGAKDVGKMTSSSTVWIAVGIICLDAILDYFMYLD